MAASDFLPEPLVGQPGQEQADPRSVPSTPPSVGQGGVDPQTPSSPLPPAATANAAVDEMMSRAEHEAKMREETNIRQEAYLVQQQVAVEMRERASVLESRGISQDEIERDLREYQEHRYGQYATFVAKRDVAKEREALQLASRKIKAREMAAEAKEYGVTVDQLMRAESDIQMRMMVLEAENKALKAQRGPTTQYGTASGNPAAGGGDDAFLAAWASGRLENTPENMARARRITGI
jgi:hypothetical protein